MPDEWLTQEDAAERLHVALDTMRRYVREGQFPRTKVGKRYLIPASAIEEFLQRGLQTGGGLLRPESPNKNKKTASLLRPEDNHSRRKRRGVFAALESDAPAYETDFGKGQHVVMPPAGIRPRR